MKSHVLFKSIVETSKELIHSNQYQKDGVLASASILYDVMNDLIVDAKLTKYRLN